MCARHCLDNARVVITNVCRRTVHIRKGAGEQKRAYNLCHKNSSGKCDIANKELYTNTSETEATQFTVREMKIERCLGVHLCLCVCVQEQKFCLLHSFFYIIFYLFGIFSPPTFFLTHWTTLNMEIKGEECKPDEKMKVMAAPWHLRKFHRWNDFMRT